MTKKRFMLIIETTSDYSIADIVKYIEDSDLFDAQFIAEFLLDVRVKAVKELDEK